MIDLTIEQHLPLAIMRAGRNWRRIADQTADEFGLTEATALPLLYLSRMEEGPRQSTLADAMRIERPSVVWLMDQLTQLGMVERREDAGDKRVRRIYLTQQGRMATLSIQQALEHQRRLIFANLDPQDIKVCLQVLESISDFGNVQDDQFLVDADQN